jgi:hypothetical protein
MKKLLAVIGMFGLLSLNTANVLAVTDPLAPTITSVNPHTGPTAGGTTITITGTNFMVGSTTVTIGGTPTTDTAVAEDGTSLTTVTVEMGPAAEDIVVTTPHGSALVEGGFTFTNGTSTPTRYTLSYAAGANGTLTGSSTQIVSSGGNGTAVTAVADGGFHFTSWSDASTNNPRTDMSASGNISVTANFAANSSTSTETHTITYNPGMNGTLSGSTTQIVSDGGSGTAVTATGDQFFQFSNWSDGSTQNPRTDVNVTSDITVSPNFISSNQAQPCNGSTFDTFTTGSVNGQGGWHVSGDFDQEIVPNTFGFATLGCKTLRVSDATTSPFIFNQTFSYTGDNEAGETDAVGGDTTIGTRQNHFEAQFDLAAVTHEEQPGMHLSVSADRGDGTRMTAVSFVDTGVGIDAFFDDVTGTSSPVTFNDTQIAWNLNRSVPHTVKLVMDFVDGDSNDVVKVYIDNTLVHTGTSWENFYRYDNDAFPAPNNKSRTVTSLSFNELGTAHPANKFNGYLIDNVTIGTSIIPDPAGDTTPPVITLNGSSTMEVSQFGTWNDPGASVHDNFDGFMAANVSGTVNTSTLGSYIITYSATDTAHNTASTTRTVNVVASSTATSTPSGTSTPTITLNGSSTVEVMLNTAFTDPGATAHDSANNALTVTATGTVNTNAIGSYTVTYSATDANNNTASTTRTVNVVAGAVSGGGGGSSGGGGYFVYSPVPGLGSITFPTTSPSSSSPITVVQVSTPTGQVLGVAVFNFKRNLKLGATGDDVQELQKYLISQGYLVLKNPTKYFGAMTMKALKAWQKAKGLPNTGYFGAMSRAEITR